MLELRTFGGLSITDDGAAISGAATQRKTLALVALLAGTGKSGLSRDKLIAYLWPESDTEHGHALLKQACYALRRDLGAPELFLGAKDLRLNPDVIASDLWRFEDALRRGDAETAVRAYAGPFLDGFFISGAPEFERWVDAERARLKQCACQAIETLATAAVARGDHQASVAWWRRLAALDPLNERTARALMEALAATGDRAGALQHARIHEALLRQELDAAPDRAFAEFVRQLQDAAPVPGQPVPAANPAPVRVVPDAPARGVTGTGVVAARSSQRVSHVVRGLAAAALAAAVGGVLYRHFQTAAVLDPNLVAVAPFDVLDPKLELWHEGLMDVLSRNLDGAGPLRTVSPTAVVRRWRGRADRASAEELGRGTGARLTVFGNVLGAGGDTVRVSAAILDAASGNLVAEVERRDLSGRVDRLADSLTVAILREIGQTQPIAAVQRSSFGATNLVALREFLQGEHFFRRFAMDSALAHYRRASASDSTFAPALRRISNVLSWQPGPDTLWVSYAFRAAAHNHSLAPRESLLITIDSLDAAIYGADWVKPSGTVVWNIGRRMHRMLEEAVRRYPEDPELWYELGEARYHVGFGAGASATLHQIREAFDHAIAVDSGFAPPLFFHTIECALRAQDVAAARWYARAYLAHGRDVDFFPVVTYVDHQLAVDRPASPQGDSLLAAMSGEQLSNTLFLLAGWPDTAEVAVLLARRLTQPRVVASFWGGDSSAAAIGLAFMLGYRGHLREALRVGGRGTSVWLPEFALLAVVPPDSAGSEFARWLRDGDALALQALPWWSARKDTLSLLAFLGKAAAIERRAARGGKADFWRRYKPWSFDRRFAAAAAQGYVALARGDTGEAVNRFVALPDSLCPFCDDQRFITAQLLEARGREREAAAMLDREVGHWGSPSRSPLSEPFWALERGRVNERLGNRAKALAGYSFVAALWVHADPELLPYVAEARAALQRLGAEPR